jgi:hypothetical protein
MFAWDMTATWSRRIVVLLALLGLLVIFATSLGDRSTAHGRPGVVRDVPKVPRYVPYYVASVTEVDRHEGRLTTPALPNRASFERENIPPAAHRAYRNAAVVLQQADPACHLSWAFLAAIGQVESNHGRYQRNYLGSDGVSRPGIYGARLDGEASRILVFDSDDGWTDTDKKYDRTVGPMQFLPSFWQVLGADGDGDGLKNPQDIDDATVAAGVYLCAGSDDLRTGFGRRAMLTSYNDSEDYLTLVLSIMRSYLRGDGAAVSRGESRKKPASRSQRARADEWHCDGSDQQSRTERRISTGLPTSHTASGGSSVGTATTPVDTGGSPNSGGTSTSEPSGGGSGTGTPGGSGTGTQGGSGSPSSGSGQTTSTPVDSTATATGYCRGQFAAGGVAPTGSQVQRCVNAYQSGLSTSVGAAESAAHAVVVSLVCAVLDPLGLGCPFS